MSTATGAAGVAIAFLSYSSVIYMIYYCLDIFLEELSVDRHTGELRGLYSIFLNGGIMLGPLLVVLIARDDNVRPVYLVGAALLIVAVLLLSNSFKIKNNHHKEPIPLPFKKWRHSANIRRVTLAKLVLEIFFTLMVIYTPLYLHNELGFAWRELGIIFTIMLLPFVIFEWPVGELADRFWGEKEMMSLGFFITGSALLIMPFLDKVFAAWLLILLLSRVGASIVEITTESYFFKQISASETGMLSIFRLVRPVGIILGALIGALTLQILAFTTIFFVVAFVIFLGIRESAYLKDTL
ncbi:MAG: MFS transporter [Candidatus Zambryskibacteria bacterium]|nr:MFS transporter [Candidatus Zambryskibacteria bacterium]